MHQVPQPKEQATLLKAYLAEAGLTLGHQRALEAIAKVMGYKNWKTMAAQTRPAPVAPAAQPVQVLVPGPADGELYDVPVTVKETATAIFQVRAFSAEEAIDAACELAHSEYPEKFTLDEGNYKSLRDFYCPDSDEVTPVAAAGVSDEPHQDEPHKALGVSDFDDTTADVANNMGMYGEFSITSEDKQYLLTALLESGEPDSSNDKRRAQCTLTVTLEYGVDHEKEGEKIVTFAQPYEYWGDDRMRGDELEGLFNDGTLLKLLANTPSIRN